MLDNLKYMLCLSPLIFFAIKYFLDPYFDKPIQATSWEDDDCTEYLNKKLLSTNCFTSIDIFSRLKELYAEKPPLRDAQDNIIYRPTEEEWDHIYQAYRDKTVAKWIDNIIEFCKPYNLLLNSNTLHTCLGYQKQLLFLQSELNIDIDSVRSLLNDKTPFLILRCKSQLHGVRNRILDYILEPPVSDYSPLVIICLDEDKNYSELAKEYRLQYYEQAEDTHIDLNYSDELF